LTPNNITLHNVEIYGEKCTSNTSVTLQSSIGEGGKHTSRNNITVKEVYSFSYETHLRATYGITQCYLSPDSSERVLP